MGGDSPIRSPSKRSSQNLETPPRTSPGLKHRASGVKHNAGGGTQDSNGEGNDSPDSRRREGSLARGDTTNGPRKLTSSFEPDAGAMSPPDSSAEPKKKIVRLTLTEAAEEIKRLRRYERKMNAEIKQHEEDAKKYMEQINQLKQQVVDNDRAHKEEMASRTSQYESETKKLKTQLKVILAAATMYRTYALYILATAKNTSDELQILQETSLPLVEARKLTFKALRKGRALQYMAQLYTNNTVLVSVKREALYKLLENAVGPDHAVFRATHGFACGIQAYSDSHLRLLRQEQLILLAENERLQAQIQEMQLNNENKRRDRVVQQEAAVVSKLEGSWPSPEPYEPPMEAFASRMMGPDFQTDGTELYGLEKAQSLRGVNKQLEMDLASAKLRSICSILRIAETRLLAYALRRLYSHSSTDSVVQTMERAINKTNVDFRNETIVTGCALVTSFVRTNEKARMLRAFWILLFSAKMQNRAKEIQTLKDQLKQAQEQEATSASNRYSAGPCRACHAWSVLSSELNEANSIRPSSLPHRGDPLVGIGLAPSQGGGIPLPVAYAPHYFRNLPSAQKRRNLYFTATPPRAQETSIPSTVQRARDMAISEETLYRPISLVEGWRGAGTNGLGIGMEPVGTVIGSHATSQGNKLDAAKGSLKSALLLPQSTPSSQPLTAAERNNAYVEQLLRATDKRMKMQ
ncbi:hypothetical protein, conserved [Eimeria brunetti]|uniref:Uncharacterized protein n=1 Tax=Eimeria brunetti TaxID=51314 RepID=U6LTG4_9EIME|nr:hypothetical protein, conserved [Eimeria brunetti]